MTGAELERGKKLYSSITRRPGVFVARLLIRIYQLTLSAIFGRHCRHLPSCSYYTDEAIDRYGLWAGGWMGVARICRCHPLGTRGLDLVPDALPQADRWYKPWAYGRWRGTNATPMEDAGQAASMVCEAVDADDGEASMPGRNTIR